MFRTPWRAVLLAALLCAATLFLATCGGQGSAQGSPLYVQQVTSNPQDYNGKAITVDGAYLWRPGDPTLSVLALGVSTLDNGLDAQPLGETIWLEGFPAEVTSSLHRPGDAVYGFVRVDGQFSSGGGFGPDGQYQHQITVTNAESIEQVKRVENRIDDKPLGDGKVSLFELQRNPTQYNGQRVTTQGYYFWNSVIYVLAEGISTEEDGTSPQPIGTPIWMEGFPPDKSAQLNVGPNNSYVWGPVEVTGTFQTGGGFGKDGAYQSMFTVESAAPLQP
ncbi:MAG: hypothetical protein HGA45_23065 [Chloroflexales bacterium]|nr:hypothetical protein [Chloroflexales bacterium]